MSNYVGYDKNYLSIKLLRGIGSSLSFIITILSILGFIEFLRLCFDLYYFFH